MTAFYLQDPISHLRVPVRIEIRKRIQFPGCQHFVPFIPGEFRRAHFVDELSGIDRCAVSGHPRESRLVVDFPTFKVKAITQRGGQDLFGGLVVSAYRFCNRIKSKSDNRRQGVQRIILKCGVSLPGCERPLCDDDAFAGFDPGYRSQPLLAG